MSKSTAKRIRARNYRLCGCFHCMGHDRPSRTQQKRFWRTDHKEQA